MNNYIFSDLERKQFEIMVNHLLFFEYGIEIQFLDDRSGDDGIDAFIGKFNEKLIAYQSKFFLYKIGNSQKNEIRDSLKKVMKKHEVEEWNLCIPKEMEPKERKWLEGHIKRNYPKLTNNILGSVGISALLDKHYNVAQAFFPDKLKNVNLDWQSNLTDRIIRKLDYSSMYSRKLLIEIGIVKCIYEFELIIILNLLEDKNIINYFRSNEIEEKCKATDWNIFINFLDKNDKSKLKAEILYQKSVKIKSSQFKILKNEDNLILSSSGKRLEDDYNRKLH